MSANVVAFPIPVPLSDIPGCLRLMADQIEGGRLGELETFIAVTSTTDGELHCYGFGNVSRRDQMVGLLQCAVIKTATGSWE